MNRHRKIKYSMCWEDPNLVIKGLDITNKDTILTIASGGENVFAILLREPKKVIAIDNNKYQIYLTKLKALAIKQLSYEEFYEFMGFKASRRRLNTYFRLTKYLSPEERLFWENNKNHIKEGVINCGKFENYLKLFRKYILRLVLNHKDIHSYLKLNSLNHQEKFFEKKWNSWLWKFLFKVFFSKTLMGLLGREKSYFTYNKKLNIANHFYRKSKMGITQIPISSNYFMELIISGSIKKNFKDHPYLDKSNFLKLKKLVGNIGYVINDIEDHLSKNSSKYTKCNLSDIFERCSQEEYENILKNIVENSPQLEKICYWNNMVNRSNHNINLNLHPLKELSNSLFKQDRVFFYTKFIVEEIK